jgi:SAM-dependent methyltransferase
MPARPALPPIPRFPLQNMVPTLNGTGFMFEVLDRYARDWIEVAARSVAPALDIGCAYGVSVIPALAAGATVTACDMEGDHLRVLESRVAPALRGRLRLVTGRLPEVEFTPGEFGSILCSRVLHFLDGTDIDTSLAKMAHWLAPGGHLYLVADTPYGIWRRFIPHFEDNRRRGERWPGLMRDPRQYLPTPRLGRYLDRAPFMNLLDPELLTRACEQAGLQVLRASFIERSDFRGLGALDGRENVGVLAIRPVSAARCGEEARSASRAPDINP